MKKYILPVLIIFNFSVSNSQEFSYIVRNNDNNDISFVNQFPPIANQRHQDNSCVGFAVVYGIITHYLNLGKNGSYDSKVDNSLINKKNKIIYSPIYNLKKLKDGCEKGVSPDSILKSIIDNGLAYFNPKQVKLGCKYGDPFKIDSSIKISEEDIVIQKPPSSEFGFESKMLDLTIQKTPFAFGNGLINHALICVGKNSKGYLCYDSNEDTLITMPIKQVKNFQWILYYRDSEEKAAYNESKNQVIHLDSKNYDQLDSKRYGAAKNQEAKWESDGYLWWLGRPDYSFAKFFGKPIKYFYTNHENKFSVSVLKLSFLSRKSIIGVYTLNRKKLLYTAKLKPKEKFVFVVGKANFRLTYQNKSFKRCWKLRPEINYYISKQKLE